MQRKLLLLCNPGYEECGNYVPQAIKITEAYRQYFQSSVGGVWRDDEIDEMPNYLIGMGQNLWLANKIKEYDKLDYSLIVFVGHGGTSGNSDYIQLRGGKLFAIKDLYRNENTIKRTIIIDSCRSFIEPDIFNLLIETLEKNIEDCRNLYNAIIKDAKPHYELLQSTQYGELAKTTVTGSVFSDAFFNVMKRNISNWKSQAINEKQSFKTINGILGLIKTEMGSYGQIPQYTNISDSYFPIFAIKSETVLL